MPYIDIRLAGASLDATRRDALLARTTELMTSVMGKRREVTVVSIEEFARRDWSVGGVALTSQDAPGAYVDIKVTRDTNSPQQKAAMIAATTSMLRDVLGALQPASYVVIHEIAADAWGYGGLTQAQRAAGRAA